MSALVALLLSFLPLVFGQAGSEVVSEENCWWDVDYVEFCYDEFGDLIGINTLCAIEVCQVSLSILSSGRTPMKNNFFFQNISVANEVGC